MNLDSEKTNSVDRMSEKELIFKKPFNSIFIIENCYLFFLAIDNENRGSVLANSIKIHKLTICYFRN